MPPKADQLLEERILQAARSLWRSKGEHGLTLREVAKKAGTTTPTVYKRFRSKEDLRLALARRIRDELNAELFKITAIEEMTRAYIRFVEEHPHEYELLQLNWMDVFLPDRPRPGRAWVLTQFAARFGGKPDDYSPLFYALFFIVHGSCTLIASQPDSAAAAEVKEYCLATCDKLMQNPKLFHD